MTERPPAPDPTASTRLVGYRASGREWFKQSGLTDWAAALTYYGIPSIFPGRLVLVSCLGLFGQPTTDAVPQTITTATPGWSATAWGDRPGTPESRFSADLRG